MKAKLAGTVVFKSIEDLFSAIVKNMAAQHEKVHSGIISRRAQNAKRR